MYEMVPMFEFKELKNVKDARLIVPAVHRDERGFFLESYKKSDFQKNGISQDFVQDNHSKSARNVLRGLHFQAMPKPQGKLVRVISGSVYDVIVDLRPGSSTYKKWEGVRLNSSSQELLWVPPGFAHGFLSLEDNTELIYKTTAEYDQTLDAGVRWNDPVLAIEWPVASPLLSPKDSSLPALMEILPAKIYKEGVK